jgi:hypothetical protein
MLLGAFAKLTAKQEALHDSKTVERRPTSKSVKAIS